MGMMIHRAMARMRQKEKDAIHETPVEKKPDPMPKPESETKTVSQNNKRGRKPKR